MFKARPDEWRESRDRQGVSLERGYLQDTPTGAIVIAYIETEGPGAEAIGRIGTSDLQIDKDFVRMVKEIHGVDLAAPPEGPPPETLGVYTDPDVAAHKPGLAFSAPLLPDKIDAGREFTKEGYETRRDEMTESRRARGVCLEVVTIQSTPMGDFANIYAEGDDPYQANKEFAASDLPFDVWYKDQLKTLFPPQVDFSQPVPPAIEIFDSEQY